MNNAINFPNLGIHLSQVPKNFSIFGFKIALYGVCIAMGMLLAFLVIDYLTKKYEGNSDPYIDIIIYTIVFGVMGARAYYVAFRWELYRDNPVSVFYLREGGLAIYGGIIVGTITAIIVSRIKKLNAMRTLDYLLPGVALAQVMGRWGNFFNREAFGEYTDGIFAMELPVSAVRSDEITALMNIHQRMVDGEPFIWVTPNFLYEGIWNFLLFIVLLLVLKKRVFNGQVFLTYVIGYGSGRCWMEGLRTDQLTIGDSGIAVSQLIGGGSALIAAMILCVLLATTIVKRKTGLLSDGEDSFDAGTGSESGLAADGGSGGKLRADADDAGSRPALAKREDANAAGSSPALAKREDANAALLKMLRDRKAQKASESETDVDADAEINTDANGKPLMGDGSVRAKKRRKPTERGAEKVGAPEIKK